MYKSRDAVNTADSSSCSLSAVWSWKEAGFKGSVKAGNISACRWQPSLKSRSVCVSTSVMSLEELKGNERSGTGKKRRAVLSFRIETSL